MARKLVITLFLLAIICAVAYVGNNRGRAKSSSRGGTIVGRFLDAETQLPLKAEVGLAMVGRGAITLKHAKASEQGEYVIEDLPAGQFHLVTKLDRYATEHRNVLLREGETQHVDFVLERARQVKGVVLGPEGQAVAGARVKVFYPLEAPSRGAVTATYQWETGDVKTDRLGEFTLPVHPDREFVIEASHDEFSGTVSAPLRLATDETERYVRLSLGRALRVAGEVRDEQGKPVPGALIRIADTAPANPPKVTLFEVMNQRTKNSISDPDGAFNLQQVKPGRKVLLVLHPSYRPFRQVVDMTTNTDLAPIRVVLKKKG